MAVSQAKLVLVVLTLTHCESSMENQNFLNMTNIQVTSQTKELQNDIPEMSWTDSGWTLMLNTLSTKDESPNTGPAKMGNNYIHGGTNYNETVLVPFNYRSVHDKTGDQSGINLSRNIFGLSRNIHGAAPGLSVSRPDLNRDKDQRDSALRAGNQQYSVANELKNKKILDEEREWHIPALQLYRIKLSKRSLAPTGETSSLSHRHRTLSLTDLNVRRIRRRNSLSLHDQRSGVLKRDTKTTENRIISTGRTKRRFPSSDQIYKRLLTLDVTFYMPLNMTFNVSDANSTSDGLEKCMTLLDELFKDVEDDGRLYCNSSWDEVSCWPRTLAGTIASVPCPSYLTGINDYNNATKLCYENGTWADKAVYDYCLGNNDPEAPPESSHVVAIRIIYNVGFTVSTLTLAIALFIFLYFRSLRCLRNLVHCHLIVTFIVTNILWIIMRHTLSHMQSPSMAWMCKALISMYSFSHSTNFFWMFVEGLYLHIIIVWTYSADKIKLRYLVFIGWGLPAINLVIWIILRIELANDQCWLPSKDEITLHDFIMIGPILLVLFANTIFISTIVWVLITKLRASHSLETRQYRKAVRATVILFPLLGITYVLFIMPPSDHPKVKIVFLYINAILQSFQGLLVAIFYCFLNGEVKTVLKKKLSRYTDARNLSTKYTKTSVVGFYANSTGYGNGAVDPKHRVNGQSGRQPESIPLTETKGNEEINDS